MVNDPPRAKKPAAWRSKALVVGLLAGLAAGAGDAASPLVVGVQTHFAFAPGGTDVQAFRSWMERTGFESTRDEMFWWDVEDGDGVLALRKGALRTRDAWASIPRPFAGLLTVDFGHPRHDGGAQPNSDRGREAFAAYAKFVVGQARPHVRWVEVWNEWNMPTAHERSAGSRGHARDYVRLAQTTYRQLKAEHPDLVVLTGAAGDDGPHWKWTRQAISHGLLTHTDGLSVHLYNHCLRSFVGADELAERLDRVQRMLATAGRPQLPVYVTEVGWPTHTGECGVDEWAAAAHSLRFLLEASVRPWVAGVWFYELQDGGDDPANPEHRFGLLRRDGTEKPAGCVLRELGTLVARRPEAYYAGRASGAARFPVGDKDRWLVWARGIDQRPVTLRLASSRSAAASFTSPAPCTLEAALMDTAPDGRYAQVHLAPLGVHVIDVPVGDVLQVEEMP